MNSVSRTSSGAGVISSWIATDIGWAWIGAGNSAFKTIESYVQQLRDEGFMQSSTTAEYMPWSSVYQILSDSAHDSSRPLLQLPPVSECVVKLVSSGTPSDPSFSVSIAGWHKREAEGVLGVPLQRIGAQLSSTTSVALMTAEQWKLLTAVKALFRDGPTLTIDDRFRVAGRIRALAIRTHSILDDYLRQTELVDVDAFDLKLHKSVQLGAPVVEVEPVLAGAPVGFVKSFDKYNSVRGRYDVASPNGGVSHVALSPVVQTALKPLKAMVGRRVASDAARAFLKNPYAFLGDEAASVFLPEQFEEALEQAGIRFKTLCWLASTPSFCEVSIIDPTGREADLNLELDRSGVKALLQSADRSIDRQMPLFSREGDEIELGAETLGTLDALRAWLSAGPSIAQTSVTYAEVFDLSEYSARVVGFDGEVVVVPYVARTKPGESWIPDNIEAGVSIQSPDSSRTPTYIPLDAGKQAELSKAIAAAREVGSDQVSVPGSDLVLPVSQAQALLEGLESAPNVAAKRAAEPRLNKDPPPPSHRPTLRILHNIENLDYRTDALVPPVPLGMEPRLPALLRDSVSLMPHQLDGVAWLQHRLSQRSVGLTGAMLADDMGLGKTLQALCLIATYAAQSGAKPCLVVAPVSLLENWAAEVRKFLKDGALSVLRLYGDDIKRNRLADVEIDADLKALGMSRFLRKGFEQGHQLILTTYETLRDYEFSLGRVEWGIVICDEAQKIKNPAALVTRAAKALRYDFKIACTGTPVENSLADLWCLFDFMQPGLLGSLNEFTKKFRMVIETRQEGYLSLVETLRVAIEPWVLRRMKSDVAKLPPKWERLDAEAAPEHMSLPMSDVQRRLYMGSISEFREAMKSADGRGAMLSMLHRMRMICANPLAMNGADSESASIADHVNSSPKLRWILGQLSRIAASDEKAIVFTDYRDIQRLIQRAIAAHFDFVPDIVNGSTTVNPESYASRQAVIDRFQAKDGFNVIVLGTTAVGFGVNIQAANHVFHFTRSWNPAKEDQATDRAYRIGQAKAVHVYCPTVVASGFESFEQRLDKLLLDKRALSRDMLAGVQELSIEDFKGL